MDKRGKSGKRHPSKRVITARNEMRSAHLFHEHDEDDHDWAREKKQNVHYPSISLGHNHGNKQSKLKRRQAYKNHQDYY
ncbi:hypothetical protein DYI25_04825 [Mesobacillus boroniphilus]|uniref:Uncharacterized protein n=1 Tax=Mesobacillus boroniphilus TaxID=308892 RepID=A0A944GWU5_9BACI|nr:hypothetical protein [Mesobacillus boroniphilus]MBS8263766.1 hypothetical protein [Mesobacillus boroniphilus]